MKQLLRSFIEIPCTRIVFFAGAVLVPSVSLDAALQVRPQAILLDSPEATQQVLVSVVEENGRAVDLTRQARYAIADPKIAVLGDGGLIEARSDGNTELLVQWRTETARIPLSVQGFKHPTPVSFEHQVIPILTKAGCNSGGCHGKAEGQNGFKLSVFGFDPEADFDALVKQGRGRRVFVAGPERSLLLQKSVAEVPHGGGRRIEKNGLRYALLRRWITEGAAFSSDRASPTQSIQVEPRAQVLFEGGAQQLRVTAIDTQGNQRCVTTQAEYKTNAPAICEVDPRGVVQATGVPGEAAIMVRYMGQVATSRITVPRSVGSFTRPPETNFVDRLVWDKLERLGIAPSELADDATFLRRASLDLIGTLPTPAEARAFLTDSDAKKRSKLIDDLLQRDPYADYWAMRWADILRVDKDAITPQGAVAMTRWLRRQFAENRPYDEFVRDLLTAQGSMLAEGPASFYKAMKTPQVLSQSVSQLFLGVRIECARCHHHPFEKWGQEDYFAFAGFFTGIGKKQVPGRGEAIFATAGNDLENPRTGEKVSTRPLGGPQLDLSASPDRRAVLADWMTSPENPYFARAITNRLWAHYFGRGLVEPVDDLRATNPATNEPLHAALAQHLRDLDYDLKAFTRTLLVSRAYQLSPEANASNADDEQNFSHARPKALPAEVLLDAICQATGVPEKFNGWPEGYRAIQVWDNRMPSYFFRVFGRPQRVSVCECERSNEPSISQALHLMNSPEIMSKIASHRGRTARLARSEETPPRVIEELYLATLSRFPSDEERNLMLQAFTRTPNDLRRATEDVLWVLLNSKEFLYNH